MATADATSRIFRHAEKGGPGPHDLLTSPVGQIVGRMNASRPVAAIMEDLVRELRETIRRMSAHT
jgi:hypothetical protein